MSFIIWSLFTSVSISFFTSYNYFVPQPHLFTSDLLADSQIWSILPSWPSYNLFFWQNSISHPTQHLLNFQESASLCRLCSNVFCINLWVSFETKYLLFFIVYLGPMKFSSPQQALRKIFVELVGQAKMDRPSCIWVEDIQFIERLAIPRIH